MNERESDTLEAQLHRLKPAKLPVEFHARLEAAIPGSKAVWVERNLQTPVRRTWASWLIWLGPAAATAAVAITLLGWRLAATRSQPRGPSIAYSAPPVLKADAVEIDRQLLVAFDAVARLPDGRPVRFHCREWSDNVVWRDSARGVFIEHRAPHWDIEPVSFETY